MTATDEPPFDPAYDDPQAYGIDAPPARRGHLTAVRNDDRPVPHSPEAEAALLGAALISTTGQDALASLRADDFYVPAHQTIAAAVLELHAAGDPIDTVTVGEALRNAGQHDQLGTLLALQAPATTSAGRYAQIIRGHAHRRQLQALGHEIAHAAVDTAAEPTALASDAQAGLDELHDRLASHQGHTAAVGDLLTDYLDDLDARAAGGTDGIPTGWPNLDRLIHGLNPEALITIAARPGMGKSDVAAILARQLATAGTPVLYVSIEMSKRELMHRWVANTSHIEATALTTGQLDDWSWSHLPDAISALARIPLHVDDNPAASLATIRASAHRTGAQVIIVDYLQLIDSPKAESRQLAVTAIANGLKRLARQLHVPVVALAQLNRSLEVRGDKRPILSDLRESGAIEQDSDVVIGLYRDEIYGGDDRGVLEMCVIKNRAGAQGRARMAYDPARKTIYPLAEQKDR